MFFEPFEGEDTLVCLSHLYVVNLTPKVKTTLVFLYLKAALM